MSSRHGEPSNAASEWIDRALKRVAAAPSADPRFDSESVIEAARAEPPEIQIGILLCAVERMPELRAQASGQPAASAWRQGTALYELAVALYTSELPLSEDDIIALLSTARHACKHGFDVAAPVELAHGHACERGLSSALAGALRRYAESMTPAYTRQAQTTKRKAGLVLLLSDESGASSEDWSSRLRAGLGELPKDERRQWEGAILRMALNESAKLPSPWSKRCKRLIAALGPDRVLAFLERCWPAEGAAVVFGTAASHAMKNLVWLLEVLASAPSAYTDQADALVIRLATLEFSKRDRSEKVAVAAALYLAKRPPSIALEPLRRLNEGTRPHAKRRLIAEALERVEAACSRPPR